MSWETTAVPSAAVSADKTSAVFQDIPILSTTLSQGAAEGSPPCVLHSTGMSWQTTDVLSADATDRLSADTTDVLPADTTDVLSADTTVLSSANFVFTQIFVLKRHTFFRVVTDGLVMGGLGMVQGGGWTGSYKGFAGFGKGFPIIYL